MENSLIDDFPVGVYRTSDKIKNLKIRVKVRKIANACFTEKDPLVFGNPNELELVNIMKAPSAKAEQLFLWQEKIEKDPDKETFNRERKNKDSATISIFSHVDSDIISQNWKGNALTMPISQSSHLEKQMKKSKPKPKLQLYDMGTWQKPLFSNSKKLVQDKISKEFPIGQSMIIMAALYFDDSSSMEEMQLCFLQLDDHGTLTVVPDFTKQKSYIFLNSRSETFEYEIENISPTLTDSAIEREKYLMNKIALYKKKVNNDRFELDFSFVESPSTKISLNCEIVSARNFIYPDIFIHYTVILLEGWETYSQIEGVTETCRCKILNNVNISYYGYLFSIDLTESSSDLPKEKSLKVIFEVTSVDFWGNFRNEGYGYAEIMLIPGSECQVIHTWKIEPITLKSKLQYFFIGGMPTLDDLSYVIKPRTVKDAQLSKYGLRTISSGEIEFKSSVIIQNYKDKVT